MKQIKVQVSHSENFTAAGLMKRYADENGIVFRRGFFGTAELVIENKRYQYHHWSITTDKSVDVVTLYLDCVN